MINPVKSKAKEEKINSKRQEHFGQRSKTDWEKMREEQLEREDKKFEDLAPFSPNLNDNFNKKCKKCEERGTGPEWVKTNTRNVDEWKDIQDKQEENVENQVKETCPFKPKLEPVLEVKL